MPPCNIDIRLEDSSSTLALALYLEWWDCHRRRWDVKPRTLWLAFPLPPMLIPPSLFLFHEAQTIYYVYAVIFLLSTFVLIPLKLVMIPVTMLMMTMLLEEKSGFHSHLYLVHFPRIAFIMLNQVTVYFQRRKVGKGSSLEGNWRWIFLTRLQCKPIPAKERKLRLCPEQYIIVSQWLRRPSPFSQHGSGFISIFRRRIMKQEVVVEANY